VLPQGGYTSLGEEVVKVKRAVLIGVFFLLVAHQALAVYVIVLRNGTRIVAKDRYQVKGPNAIFVTKIGTLTSIPLSQIDVQATSKANALNLGDAEALDWVDLQRIFPTPTPTPPVSALGHIRAGIATKEGDAAKPTPTPGVGFRETRFHDQQVDEAFQQGLESYHLYLYRTSQGTQPGYLFIEIQVNGQPETLKAIQAVSSTYQLLAEKAPERLPERVEIQMINEAGKEAGLFRMSPADAAELVSGKITPDKYFVEHVIF
jgi:hypothetical protein